MEVYIAEFHSWPRGTAKNLEADEMCNSGCTKKRNAENQNVETIFAVATIWMGTMTAQWHCTDYDVRQLINTSSLNEEDYC